VFCPSRFCSPAGERAAYRGLVLLRYSRRQLLANAAIAASRVASLGLSTAERCLGLLGKNAIGGGVLGLAWPRYFFDLTLTNGDAVADEVGEEFDLVEAARGHALAVAGELSRTQLGRPQGGEPPRGIPLQGGAPLGETQQSGPQRGAPRRGAPQRGGP
jgi:hypothetical protein